MDSFLLVYPKSNQTISSFKFVTIAEFTNWSPCASRKQFHVPWLHSLAYWAKVCGLAFNFVIVILLLNFLFQILMPGKFVWSWRRMGCLQNLHMSTLFALPQPSSSQKSNFGKHLELSRILLSHLLELYCYFCTLFLGRPRLFLI